tara:strand:+ start:77 stop:301 length:225 start_codon:yes stop_codon:yes gene_type:complete
MVKDNFGRVIKKNELKTIVNTMSSQQVKNGFMDLEGGRVDGKLSFYNTDPMFDGKNAIKVNMGELIGLIIQSRE